MWRAICEEDPDAWLGCVGMDASCVGVKTRGDNSSRSQSLSSRLFPLMRAGKWCSAVVIEDVASNFLAEEGESSLFVFIRREEYREDDAMEEYLPLFV